MGIIDSSRVEGKRGHFDFGSRLSVGTHLEGRGYSGSGAFITFLKRGPGKVERLGQASIHRSHLHMRLEQPWRPTEHKISITSTVSIIYVKEHRTLTPNLVMWPNACGRDARHWVSRETANPVPSKLTKNLPCKERGKRMRDVG